MTKSMRMISSNQPVEYDDADELEEPEDHSKVNIESSVIESDTAGGTAAVKQAIGVGVVGLSES